MFHLQVFSFTWIGSVGNDVIYLPDTFTVTVTCFQRILFNQFPFHRRTWTVLTFHKRDLQFRDLIHGFDRDKDGVGCESW